MKPFVERPSARFPTRSILTFVYRGAVVGMLASIAWGVGEARLRQTQRSHPGGLAARPPGDEIVDVSRSAARDNFEDVLGLRRGERVIAIDDTPVIPGALLDAWQRADPGEYLDLTVADHRDAQHRVLVIVHP